MTETQDRTWRREILRELTPETSVAKVAKAFLIHKFDYKPGYSQTYKDTMKRILGGFVRRVGDRQIQSITVEDCELFIMEPKKRSPRNNRKSYLSQMMKFAFNQNLIPANPIDRVDTLAPAEPRSIEMLSNEQVQETLNYCLNHDTSLMPLIWLQLGLGLRRPEAFGCQIKDLDLVIDGAATKLRARRVIPIPHWLLPAPASLKIYPHNLRERMEDLKNFVGGHWPTNAMRHTAISHWLNDDRYTIENVARYMGNSPDTIQGYYNALATRRESEVFRGLWIQALR